MSENTPPRSLAEALDLKLSELLDYDLGIGLLVGGGAAWLANSAPETLGRAIPIAAGLVGVMIGAIIAGVAILGALLDQAFLRKLQRISREPVRYMAPFLFTAVLGIATSLCLLVLHVLLPNSDVPTWARGIIAFFAGWGTGWTLASVLPALGMLVQFMGLQMDAANVTDEPEVRPLRPNENREEQ